jgi:hypothetical protein
MANNFEVKELSGSAFYNDYKKADNQPSYRGDLRIDGVLYKQSIWVKVSKNGKKWLSFSYQKADEDTGPKGTKSQPAPVDELDDEIPF